MNNIIISTGGTGGHVIPAQVLYDYLKDENQVIITSDKRGINYLYKKKNYKTKLIDVPKINRSIIGFFPFLFTFIYSIARSYKYLKQKKIKILISTGGYMSIPICLAAKVLKVKIFLFEPNLVLGNANRFLLNYSEKIFTYSKNVKNFPLKMYHKNFLIRPLIRKDIFLSKRKIKKRINTFSLLIIGGSQGTKIFDNLFYEDLIKLSKQFKIKVFHQTSKNNLKKLKKIYLLKKINHQVFSYSNRLFEIIKKSDFVITRSGASTINELVFLEVPFLAIPFPFAKDNHQYYNAKYYVKKNLGWLINQSKIKKNFLYKFITNLIKNKNLLNQKKKNMNKFNRNNNLKINSNFLKKLIR